MSLPDPDNDPYCPSCGDQVPDGELVSLTGHPDLCGVCADEACKRPVLRLWDEYGTPRLPHVPCPRCGESDEVGSHCDMAWCCTPGCGWKGSLTEMRARRPLMSAAERDAYWAEAALGYRGSDVSKELLRGQFQPMSIGYEKPRFSFWDRVAIVGVTAICTAAVGAVFLSWWWSR